MPPTDVLMALKHRTASAQLGGASWEFTPSKGLSGPLVIARVLQGSRAFDIEIPVCSSRHPRRFCWSIRRTGEDTWRVSGSQYGLDTEEMMQPTPFAEGLAVGSLDLSCAPEDVRRELEALDDDVGVTALTLGGHIIAIDDDVDATGGHVAVQVCRDVNGPIEDGDSSIRRKTLDLKKARAR